MPAKNHRKRRPATQAQADFARHARKCTICHHPDRDAIEEAFIDWTDSYYLYKNFDLGSKHAVYCHAHATGLFDARRRNVRIALESLIEGAGNVRATPDSVIRAVHALSRVDDKGRWIEPVRRVVVAKRAVLSQQTQSSLNETESRRAISYQGEISSQEIMPLEVRGMAKRALPTKEEEWAKNDRERLDLLEKVRAMGVEIQALLEQRAREQASQQAQPPQSEVPPSDQMDSTERSTEQPAPPPPSTARQLFTEPPLREILTTATEALDADRSAKFLIETAGRLEIAAPPTKQRPDPNSNRD